MNEKPSILLYKDKLEMIDMVTKGNQDLKADILDALINFAVYGDETLPSDKPIVVAVMFPIIQDIKRDTEKWLLKCESNSKNAKKRWDMRKDANASDSMQTHTNASERIPDDATLCDFMRLDANYADKVKDTDKGMDKVTDKGMVNVMGMVEEIGLSREEPLHTETKPINVEIYVGYRNNVAIYRNQYNQLINWYGEEHVKTVINTISSYMFNNGIGVNDRGNSPDANYERIRKTLANVN